MGKKVRLTESQLANVVRESVRKVLREMDTDTKAFSYVGAQNKLDQLRQMEKNGEFDGYFASSNPADYDRWMEDTRQRKNGYTQAYNKRRNPKGK